MKKDDIIQALKAQQTFQDSLSSISDKEITQKKAYVTLAEVSRQLIQQITKIRDRDLPLDLSLVALAFMGARYSELFTQQKKAYDDLTNTHTELRHTLTLPQPLPIEAPRVASSRERPEKPKDVSYYLSEVESLREKALLCYNALVEHHEKVKILNPAHDSIFLQDQNKTIWTNKFKAKLDKLPLDELIKLAESWKADLTNLSQCYGKGKALAKDNQSNQAGASQAGASCKRKPRMFVPKESVASDDDEMTHRGTHKKDDFT